MDATKPVLSLAALSGLVSLAALTGLAVSEYIEFRQPVSTMTELKGIRLGEKLSDVKLRVADLGSPSATGDFDRYEHKKAGLSIYVKDERVRMVGYECANPGDSTAVNRIACGHAASEITWKFGDKARVLCPKADPAAGARRVVDVVDYGVRYVLRRHDVVSFMVADKDTLQGLAGIDYAPCP